MLENRQQLQAAVLLAGDMLATALAVIVALVGQADVLALVVALGAPWALGWLLAWQLRRLDTENTATCLRLFRSNRDAGLLAALFLAIAARL